MGKQLIKSKFLQISMVKRSLLFLYLGLWKILAHVIKDDKTYISLTYRVSFGKALNWSNLKTLNEKMQWLKLYDRKPIYTILVDKYLVKRYLSDRFNEEYVIPNYGVWKSANDINFDLLPDKFVLKCNHNSGTGLCICKDKTKLNILKVREELNKGLKEDYYIAHREWPYKDVPRRIIAEQYLETKNGKIPNDYKLHFLNGKLQFVYVSYDREGSNDRCTYDKDWDRLPFVWVPASTYRSTMNTSNVPKPDSFDKMIEFGTAIAKDFKYVRVDFYDVDGKLYFGEITLYHGSGHDKFFPSEYDLTYGTLLQLD